jgi:hypothetical protein
MPRMFWESNDLFIILEDDGTGIAVVFPPGRAEVDTRKLSPSETFKYRISDAIRRSEQCKQKT